MKEAILLPLTLDEFEFIFYLYGTYIAARDSDFKLSRECSRHTMQADGRLRATNSRLGMKLVDLAEALE